MSKVTVVAHPKTGLVVNPTKKEGFGSIRVDSSTTSMENGFVNISNRTAFINGKLEDLNALNLAEGAELTGVIQRRKSKTPQYEGHPKVINPTTKEELDFYQQYFYTADVNAPVDTWITEESTASVERENVAAEA